MITKLEEKTEEFRQLGVELRHSNYMYNVLWTKQESLSILCYKIKKLITYSPYVYIVLKNQDGIRRVIKFTDENFKNSPLRDIKLTITSNHIFPQIEIETYKG